MFYLGGRFTLYLIGKALVSAGLLSTVISVLLSADVAILVSIGMVVLGNILMAEAYSQYK